MPVDPDLPEADWRHLERLVDDTITAKGGEVAARRRARSIAATYRTLSARGRLNFLRHLAVGYGRDGDVVDRAIAAVTSAEGPTDRDVAEARLRETLEPGREQLLRRLGGVDDGFGLLVAMREELLPHRRSDPALAALERNLRRLLESWFDVALLELRQLTWDSPASLLERLIEYEAVHEITSWSDLKRRLGPGRRCYAFLHPGMPDDPLIFVEVALTRGVADDLAPLLDRPVAPDRPTGFEHDVDETRADSAIFYSISNCQPGLAGVSLGDLLIKSVVNELLREMPGLRHFATLSPIPGFRDWLAASLAAAGRGEPDPVSGLEADSDLATALDGLLERGPDALAGSGYRQAEAALAGLAARYLTRARRTTSGVGTRAADGVAHFHLSNGAVVDRINPGADRSDVGWARSLGMMVNYRYRLKDIESNHDGYMASGRIPTADDVRKLAEAEPVLDRSIG